MIEQPTIPMVEHALSYTRKQWAVFPLAVHGKVPIKDSHGLKDATTDPQKIQTLWTPNPDYNIGLATGAASGIIILDIDLRHDGNNNLQELQRRYGKLPSTRLSRTPRGGFHRYYKHPQDDQIYGNAIELDHLSGIDVRGDGGYAVLPPSTMFGGKARYKWIKSDFPIAKAPDWLLGLIKKAEKQAIQQERQFATPNGDKWFLEAIGRASEGNRNAVGFHLVCQLRDDGVSESEAREIILAYAARVGNGKTPYKETEALASLKSAYRRPPRPPARRGN